MFVINLIDTKQYTLLVLSQIGEPFEVYRHRNLKIQLFQLRDRVRDQVVMLEWADRKFDTGHAAQLLGPEATGVDDMFTSNRPFIGDDFPTIGGLDQLFDLCMLKVAGTAFLGGNGIGVDGAGGVDVAFAVGPHAAEQVILGHDRAQLLGLFRSHKAAILYPDGLEHAIGGL